MREFRTETDSLGVVEVPAHKLWEQTQRSLDALAWYFVWSSENPGISSLQPASESVPRGGNVRGKGEFQWEEWAD